MHRAGGIGRKPVGLAGLPDLSLRGPGDFRDLHRAALERNDDAAMVVAMSRKWLVGEDQGLPNLHVSILELRSALGFGFGCRGRRGERDQKTTRPEEETSDATHGN